MSSFSCTVIAIEKAILTYFRISIILSALYDVDGIISPPFLLCSRRKKIFFYFTAILSFSLHNMRRYVPLKNSFSLSLLPPSFPKKKILSPFSNNNFPSCQNNDLLTHQLQIVVMKFFSFLLQSIFFYCPQIHGLGQTEVIFIIYACFADSRADGTESGISFRLCPKLSYVHLIYLLFVYCYVYRAIIVFTLISSR